MKWKFQTEGKRSGKARSQKGLTCIKNRDTYDMAEAQAKCFGAKGAGICSR